MVNQNVIKAITHGSFARAKTLDDLGNLMEYEDKHIFMVDKSHWSPRPGLNDRQYSKQIKNKLMPGQNPNSVHINMFDLSRDITYDQERKQQDKKIAIIKKENKERMERLA